MCQYVGPLELHLALRSDPDVALVQVLWATREEAQAAAKASKAAKKKGKKEAQKDTKKFQ